MGTEAGWYTRRKNKSEYEAALCEKAERYGEQRAVEGICKRLRYWQKELNVAFDYAADIENGGWKETP